MSGYIDMAHAAKLTKLHPDTLKRRLKLLDEQYGGILVRLSDSPRGKLYTTIDGLRKACPGVADDVDPLDLIEMVNRIDGNEHRIERLNAEIVKLRREFRRLSKRWMERAEQ